MWGCTSAHVYGYKHYDMVLLIKFFSVMKENNLYARHLHNKHALKCISMCSFL